MPLTLHSCHSLLNPFSHRSPLALCSQIPSLRFTWPCWAPDLGRDSTRLLKSSLTSPHKCMHPYIPRRQSADYLLFHFQLSLRLDASSVVVDDWVWKNHSLTYKRHQEPPMTCQVALRFHSPSLGMSPNPCYYHWHMTNYTVSLFASTHLH